MEIYGAAIGIVIGLAIPAVAFWKFPKFRRDALRSPDIVIMVVVLGGWVGYQIFSLLFHG